MSDRIRIFTEMLDLVPRTHADQPHLVDLASGHGKFALAAASCGWRVTAVDVRDERFPDDDRIAWQVADLRDFEIPEADCISVLGVLYHLEIEAILSLLRRCAGTPTILDTHTTPKSDVETHGYTGTMFWEDQAAPTASSGNEYSFWPTHQSLVRMLHDCGFAQVYKRVPEHSPGRAFWMCL